MAITNTPRFGLKKYSVDTDPHPTRVEFNLMIDGIENNGVIASKGTSATRPSAGLGNRFYWSTDALRLYWDDGVAWQDLNPVGGGGAGTPIVIGGTASEGDSARAARANHTHVIPLATTSADGAMPGTDKAKLDGSTASATANKLALRDGSGRAQFATPSSTNDAANKGYVDTAVATSAPLNHSHSAADVTSGEFDPARLPSVTGSAKGAMLAADKTKLDAATSVATANAIVSRDAGGRFRAVDPSVAGDVATKGYVDTGLAAHAGTGGATHAAATGSVNGFMPSADKAKLDAATSAATPSTIVLRDAAGRAKVAAPAASDDVATKAYVDSKPVGRTDTPPFGHMGLTTGTQSVNSTSYVKTVMAAAQVLKNGFTYDDANDALVVPTTGWYEIVVVGHLSSMDTSGNDSLHHAMAYNNGVPLDVSAAAHADSDSQFGLRPTSTGLKLLAAGSKIQLYQKTVPARGSTTSGSNGYDGCYVEVKWYAADS